MHYEFYHEYMRPLWRLCCCIVIASSLSCLLSTMLFCPSTMTITSIRGNSSTTERQRVYDALQIHCSRGIHNVGIGRRLAITSVDIWRHNTESPCAQVGLDVTVEREMCNAQGTLHGACAAYIVGSCSDLAIVALGGSLGPTRSLNMVWHRAIPSGTTLRIVASATCAHGRVRTAKCEIWDAGRMCVSGVHTSVKAKL